MDFISLAQVLEDIAVSAPVVGSDMAAMYSRAAAEFHQKLHNSSQRPKWVEISKETGLPLLNDAVADEGMSILKHMAGWKRREVEGNANHVAHCLACGLDPDIEPQALRMNAGQYDWMKHPFMREKQVGFDRAEFMAFLVANGSEQKDTPALRRMRIQAFVNSNHAKGMHKAESFRKLAATEDCSVDNIKRIYYHKK